MLQLSEDAPLVEWSLPTLLFTRMPGELPEATQVFVAVLCDVL